MGGPTRRRVLAAAGAGGAAVGLAGCSLLRSDACASVHEQMRLLADGEYATAAKFVPHDRLPDTGREEARELMAFRAQLLFPGDATLTDVTCLCRRQLSAAGRGQLQRLMAESPVSAPDADLSKAVYVRYRVTTDSGRRTGRDVYSDVLYYFDGTGPFVAFVSGSQKARLPVGDCR